MNYFYKIIPFISMFIYTQTSLSQSSCSKYYSPESVLSIILQDDNRIEIIDEKESYGMGELYYLHIFFEGYYSITENKLTLFRKNEEYSFSIIENKILLASDAIKGRIKANEKFYCISFIDNDNRLYFDVKGENMGWKNEKMYGTWIFRDYKFDIYHFEYDKGVIRKKTHIPKNHESQVLRINHDSLRRKKYQEMMKFKPEP